MTMNVYDGRALSQTGSATALEPVAPTDDADLPGGPARGLFVGGAGDVVVHDGRGVEVVIASQASQYHPVRIRRVLQTGTTATAILALY